MARMTYYGFRVFVYAGLTLFWGQYFLRETPIIGTLIKVLPITIMTAYLLIVLYGLISHCLAQGRMVKGQLVEAKTMAFIGKTGTTGSLNLLCLRVDGDDLWLTTHAKDLRDLGSKTRGTFWVQGTSCTYIPNNID